MSAKTIILVALTIAPYAAASGKNNVGSVIKLLTDLKAKAVEEGKAEEAAFATFSFWCKNSIATLKEAISEEDATIDQLGSALKGFKQTEVKLDGDQAKIKEYKADTTLKASLREEWVEEIDGEIPDLASEIKRLQAAQVAAKTKDTKRRAAYDTKIKNLKDTVTAVTSALAKMQKAEKGDDSELLEVRDNVGQVLALLSMEADDDQRQTLVDFVSEEAKPDVKATGDRAAAVKKYTSKSGPVIELLKKLVLKFQDDVVACNTEETAAKNAYALEKQARAAALAAVKKSKGQKDTTEAATQASITTTDGDLANAAEDKAADKATLKATSTQCNTRTREWQERSKTRSRELEAMSMAIKILAKVSGVRTEAPKNPALGASPVSLLQIDDPQARVVNLLHKTAETTHSNALERLSMQIAAHKGPFEVVEDSIQKMVYQLMAEQTSEDKHKEWCNLELAKTSKSKSDKDDKLAALNANIGENTALVSKLTNEITEADKMVSDINKYMAESTEIRNTGRMENKLAIKDAAQAETAIANAVAVLEEHYKSTGMVKKESYEFIQTAKGPIKLPKDPALWDSGYTGVSDPTKAGEGVLAILLEVASDFSKMEAETKAQEAEDQKDYDTEMAAHKVEMKRRQTESAAKASNKKRQIAKGVELAAQKKHLVGELAAVAKYQDDLQTPCVVGEGTYLEKKALRNKEIDALKSSIKTLRSAFKPAKKAAKFLQVKPHA